jgi:sigma-B regulation protein RsbU (phosphoserine phosphatase)
MSWKSLVSHRSSHQRLTGRPAVVVRRPGRSAPGDHPELAQDLRMARELQQGLLLQTVPRLHKWELAAASLPASELGGDLYDFPTVDENWHGLMIGDVSGHGLAAALRMAVARTLFRQIAREKLPPGETLAVLNRALISEMPHGMVTMLYVHAEIHTGTLRIANAGHNFPVLIGKDVRELEVTGLPLGIDPDAEYETITATLDPGETALLYTDGITEANDARERMYGFTRFQSLLLRNHQQRPRSMMATILNTVKAWSGNTLADDMTMVVMRRRLPDLNAELRNISVDVMGEMGAAALWVELGELPADVHAWQAALPKIGKIVQARHGRGLSRELLAQLRLTLEEYRTTVRAELDAYV